MAESQAFSYLREQILRSGTLDASSPGFIVGLAEEHQPDADEHQIRETVFAVVRDLLQAKLVRIGTLDPRRGCIEPWEGSASHVLQKLEAEWDDILLDPERIVDGWLENTAAGDVLGAQMIERNPSEEPQPSVET